MSTDQETISNLLKNITPSTSNEFAHVRWIDEILDLNHGNYNSGTIRFDTINQKDYWINWKDAFITIPIVITGTTPANQAVGSSLNVALKNGVAQLIYSFQMSINNAKIQNSDNLNRFAGIMQMVEDSFDYQYSTGSMYHLAKDTFNSSDANEFLTMLVASPAIAAAAAVPAVPGVNGAPGTPAIPAIVAAIAGATNVSTPSGRNPAFNKGFYDRVQFIKSGYILVNNVGSWNFRVIIPMALISRFFRELDIPLYNARVTMNIGITDILSGQSQATAMIADATAVATCGVFKMAIGNNVEQNCKLYLPQVIFSPVTQGLLASMINAGYTKTVTFYDTKSIWTPLSGASSPQKFTIQLTPGLIAPQKLFLTANPAGQDALQSSPSPCQSTGQLANANVLIDGNKHYSSDLLYDFQFYELLKKEFYNGGDGNDTQSGSLINWKDFSDIVNGNHRYYAFDISRQINSNPNPLKPFALAFSGALQQAGNYDVWVHIQYRVVVIINMSTGIVHTEGSN